MINRNATSTLLAGLLATSPAFAEGVKAYQLDPSYNIRSEKSAESQRFSTIGRSAGELESVQIVPGEKWYTVKQENGGTGYVNRRAVREIKIDNSFVVRANPSLKGAVLRDALKPSKSETGPILTGQSRLVKESDKTVLWKEMIVKGQRAWIAAGAVSSDAKNEMKPASPIRKEAKPRAQAEEKPVTPKPTKKETSKKAAGLSVDTPTDKKVVKAELPVPAPATGGEEKKPAKKEARSGKPAQEKNETKADPKAEALAQKPSDVMKTKPVDVAAPGAKPKAEGPECVRKASDFKASENLKKAFGKVNPFQQWDSTDAMARASGTYFEYKNEELTVIAGPLGVQLGNPARTPIQVCTDEKGIGYLLLNSGKRYLNKDSSVTLTKAGFPDTTYAPTKAAK